MKRSKLILQQDEYGNYHAIFKTEHGRVVYLALAKGEKTCSILECVYLDRSNPCSPSKQTTKTFSADTLLKLVREELDKDFSDVIWQNDEVISKETLVALHQTSEKKQILLFLKEGNVIRTIFKSRVYRAILLEVRVSDGVGLITRCHYCDKRDKGRRLKPHGLTTIFFPYSLKHLLEIVNNELEGGFTDVMISDDHTVALDRPICGWI